MITLWIVKKSNQTSQNMITFWVSKNTIALWLGNKHNPNLKFDEKFAYRSCVTSNFDSLFFMVSTFLHTIYIIYPPLVVYSWWTLLYLSMYLGLSFLGLENIQTHWFINCTSTRVWWIKIIFSWNCIMSSSWHFGKW